MIEYVRNFSVVFAPFTSQHALPNGKLHMIHHEQIDHMANLHIKNIALKCNSAFLM